MARSRRGSSCYSSTYFSAYPRSRRGAPTALTSTLTLTLTLRRGAPTALTSTLTLTLRRGAPTACSGARRRRWRASGGRRPRWRARRRCLCCRPARNTTARGPPCSSGSESPRPASATWRPAGRPVVSLRRHPAPSACVVYTPLHARGAASARYASRPCACEQAASARGEAAPRRAPGEHPWADGAAAPRQAQASALLLAAARAAAHPSRGSPAG